MHGSQVGGGGAYLLNPHYLGLHKILFHFVAFVWESIIILLPPHLQCLHYCSTIHDYCAIYDPLPRPPLCIPYAINY